MKISAEAMPQDPQNDWNDMTTSTDTLTEAQIKRNGSAFFALVMTGLGCASLLGAAIVAARFVLEGALPSEWIMGAVAGVTGLAMLIWAAVERRRVKPA